MSYCGVQRTMVGPRLSPGRLSTCETNAGLHESFPGPLCAKSAGVLVGIFSCIEKNPNPAAAVSRALGGL